MSDRQSPALSRREALTLATGLIALGTVGDAGCTKADDGTDTDAGETDVDRWATGGTAAMSGDYPDPFTALGTACTLTCRMTLGPCYGEVFERKDISEGHAGLPLRLSFQVVDETCTPIAGASVDVWHPTPGGLYSGANITPFCNNGDADMLAHNYFRGVQTTDANGRVDFDTCFPGWYGGRTTHIHFQVRRGSEEYATAQVFFEDALVDEINTVHPDYAPHGLPETHNAEDAELHGASPTPYVAQTARMPDGALQAWMTLVIRSSLSDAICDPA